MYVYGLGRSAALQMLAIALLLLRFSLATHPDPQRTRGQLDSRRESLGVARERGLIRLLSGGRELLTNASHGLDSLRPICPPAAAVARSQQNPAHFLKNPYG